MKDFVRSMPLVFYFFLTCIISWLSLLPIIGIDGLTGKIALPENQMPLLFIAMCAGPFISGILSIYLNDGNAGLKKLVIKMVRWKVKFSYYIIALFAAPAITAVAYLSLTLYSPKFIPLIFSSENTIMIIMGGIVGGIVAGFFEEIGWTGFAIPRLRSRYSIFTTGLIVGIVWGIWHFPLFMIKDQSGVVPLIILLLFRLITHLPAFRILMTWVYDRTQSLLVIIFMHMSFTACAMIFQPATESGIDIIIANLTFAVLLYVTVIIINIRNQGQVTKKISVN